MENDGFMVHEFPIDKSWQEETFKAEVRKVFPILVLKCANFKFAKACYGEIVSPKVADDITMNLHEFLAFQGKEVFISDLTKSCTRTLRKLMKTQI